MTNNTTSHTAQLATFAAGLRFEDIPEPVVRKIEDLLVDWFGSAVAGHGSRPVETITRFAQAMGPSEGPSEVIINGARTTPYLAAMANAAASHVAEQDDVHNGSVFHPATVVFPPAVAVAQALGASGKQLLAASVVGYEVGIRVGEFLGRSHYRVFHTTGTAGTLAAAAAVGHLLGLNAQQMQHALGSAGTQSAGLWEFLRTAADSKQLHTAHAAAAGLMSAYLAKEGFTGAAEILEGPQGMAAGMSSDADPSRLVDGLGSRWALLDTAIKPYPVCHFIHGCADAALALRPEIGSTEIVAIEGREVAQAGDGWWWTIPREKMKMRRNPLTVDLRVPLEGRALAVVKRRLQVTPAGYLFPSTSKKRGHIDQKALGVAVYVHMPHCEFREEWIRPRLPVAGWAPHDLRRTGRTLLASLGCPTEVAEAILGHLQPGIVGTYNRFDYAAERRAWLRQLSAKLESLARQDLIPSPA